MGQTMPIPDERLEQVIELLKLSQKDVLQFWNLFKSIDKAKTGTIDIDVFYDLVHEPPTVFADHLFELIDTDQDGVLDFSEFVQAVCTYGMFAKIDVLKFCFYVFDKDKNGFIEFDELKGLVKQLHTAGNTLNTNIKLAVGQLEDKFHGRVTFSQFLHLNENFPQLLFPAFRLQRSIMHYVLGDRWWDATKRRIQAQKDRERALAKQIDSKEQERARRAVERRVRKEMGCLAYNCCPCMRGGIRRDFALEEEAKGSDDEDDDSEDDAQKAGGGRAGQPKERGSDYDDDPYGSGDFGAAPPSRPKSLPPPQRASAQPPGGATPAPAGGAVQSGSGEAGGESARASRPVTADAIAAAHGLEKRRLRKELIKQQLLPEVLDPTVRAARKAKQRARRERAAQRREREQVHRAVEQHRLMQPDHNPLRIHDVPLKQRARRAKVTATDAPRPEVGPAPAHMSAPAPASGAPRGLVGPPARTPPAPRASAKRESAQHGGAGPGGQSPQELAVPTAAEISRAHKTLSPSTNWVERDQRRNNRLRARKEMYDPWKAGAAK